MKYKRVLCWVRPHEKKRIIKAIEAKMPIKFAKNYNDFKTEINENDYLVFSIVKAAKGFKKCQQLVRDFPRYIFHLYYRDNGVITGNELDMFLENNVYQGQQTSEGIFIGLGL